MTPPPPPRPLHTPPTSIAGAHHSDIGNNFNPLPIPQDTPEVIAARELEIAYLNQWVREFHAERAAAKAFLARDERAA